MTTFQCLVKAFVYFVQDYHFRDLQDAFSYKIFWINFDTPFAPKTLILQSYEGKEIYCSFIARFLHQLTSACHSKQEDLLTRQEIDVVFVLIHAILMLCAKIS